MLVHLVDAAPGEGRDPTEDYRTIRRELEAFAPELAAKREIVALNKIDLVPREELDEVRRQFASRIGVPAASVRLVERRDRRGMQRTRRSGLGLGASGSASRPGVIEPESARCRGTGDQ